MVAPGVAVSPLFAAPFGSAQLTPCDGLNRELERLFLTRENDEHRNPTPSHIPQQETFESRFNLFRWPEAPVQELRRFMLDSIAQMILQTTTLTSADLARRTISNHTWFHISRYAGSFVAHNHPLASWSAVYCVRAGSPVEGHPESGLLRFFDPRAGADSFVDAAIAPMHRAFALRPVDIRLAEGQLIVFPSYVFHEVTPFYGPDLRITVATNAWVV